jgi:hypothetical protein
MTVKLDAALDLLRWVQPGGLSFDHPEDSSLPEVLSIDADSRIYRHRAGKPLMNLLKA